MNHPHPERRVRSPRDVSGLGRGRTTRLVTASLSLHLFAAAELCEATTITFDDVLLNESYAGPGGGNYYNGSAASQGVGDWDGSFATGGARFANTFSEIDFGGGTFTTWQGFAVSSTSDTLTAGFQNQYSAWPSGRANGALDPNYAIAFGPTTIDFGRPVTVSEVHLANTTYAALSMRLGDSFANAFGDDPSTSVVEEDFPSWFLLTISGSLAGLPAAQTVDLYLADYRFNDNSLDFILDDWVAADLSPLGDIDRLHFTITSSDTGPFGINTPGYFALDQLTYTPLSIPEPGTTAFLSVVALVSLLTSSRQRRS